MGEPPVIVAVVPARAGSKGVPGKNLLDVAGKPLIGHILEAAGAVEGLAALVVSSEDEAIRETARAFGARTPFERPAELAEDHVSLVDVMVHAVSALDAAGLRADAILSLQPTAPLLTTASIQAAVDLFRATGCDSVFSVREVVHNHPYRCHRVDGSGAVTPYEPDGERFLQRQDLPVLYSSSGGLYLRRRELLEAWSGEDFCLGTDRRAVIVGEAESLNVDTPFDLALLRTLLDAGEAPAVATGAGR